MVSDEKFFAWLDGELDAAEAARVAAEVAADAELSVKAAEHRVLQARLTGAFDRLLGAPVPASLLGAVRQASTADIVDFAAAKQRRKARNWRPVAQWTAMAATLAVGVLLGTLVPSQRHAGPVQLEGGRMFAASAVGDALSNELASAPSGDVLVGMTFRDQAGDICRTFTTDAASGLACRAGGRWQLKGLFAAPEGQASDYRMAAGMDPNLAALVDSAMAGEPFNAAQERAAKGKGWR